MSKKEEIKIGITSTIPKQGSHIAGEHARLIDFSDHHRSSSTKFIILITIFGSIGGALFGYDTGVISGAMILIASQKSVCEKYGGFGLSHIQQEVVVDATVGGAIIGSIFSGWFCDRYGRRPVIMFGSFLFTIGSFILGISNGINMLIIGRLIVGLAIGFSSHATPLYIAEVSPSHIRGKLVSSFNAFIVAGQVFAALIDGGFFYVKEGWRYMLGFAAILSITQYYGFLYLPESPRWMLKVNREQDATKILQKIRGTDNVQVELNEMQESLIQNQSAMSISQIFHSPETIKALRIGCGLMMLQQSVGINTVMYYSATILELAGFGHPSGEICCCEKDSIPIWLAAVTAFSQFIGCISGMFLSDKYGRRPLICGSLFGVIVFLILLGASFKLPQSSLRNTLSLLSLIGYLLCFGFGMSPVPWVMNSEIYPLRARSACASIAVGTNWLSNFIISGTFLSVADSIGISETFWIFASIGIVGWLWIYFKMPETFGKSLEEIELLFDSEKKSTSRAL